MWHSFIWKLEDKSFPKKVILTEKWSLIRAFTVSKTKQRLISWCFEHSQPQRITPGLNTNFTLSRSHSFHKSWYHKSCFWAYLYSAGTQHGNLHHKTKGNDKTEGKNNSTWQTRDTPTKTTSWTLSFPFVDSTQVLKASFCYRFILLHIYPWAVEKQAFHQPHL